MIAYVIWQMNTYKLKQEILNLVDSMVVILTAQKLV